MGFLGTLCLDFAFLLGFEEEWGGCENVESRVDYVAGYDGCGPWGGECGVVVVEGGDFGGVG
jgi:hypothetical protein